jgi:RNA polymerase sigma-70 factor (ECF subfamily)
MAKFIITPEEKARLKQLVLDAQKGNREAFGDLFQRYEGMILVIATRKLGNNADAQELCQDVFVQAMQKLPQLRAPEAFGSWLKRIAHRMAINRMVRKGPVIATDPANLVSKCDDYGDPIQGALDAERCEQVRAGLSRLRDLDRETLEAFYIKGHSLREMSASFDAPLGTIKRRLHMARKRLSEEVEELIAV